MEAFFSRHKVIVLQFSGGKDSLACLHLLKGYWDRFIVLWINTGDAFPETIELMRKVRAEVPRFVEFCSNQPKNHEVYGPPADVLPVWDTPFGRELDSSRRYKLQTPFECCSANIWAPMEKISLALGATGIIRGQRNEEHKKGLARSGSILHGVEYWFPLEDWSTGNVYSFLNAAEVELPRNYPRFDTSLDCQQCTAYVAENQGKGRYMQEYHPVAWAKRQDTMKYILEAVTSELRYTIAES